MHPAVVSEQSNSEEGRGVGSMGHAEGSPWIADL